MNLDTYTTKDNQYIANEIEQIIYDCCEELEIENKYYIPNSQWFYVVNCINKRFITPNKTELLYIDGTCVNEYDVNKVTNILYIYNNLCYKYNQTIYLIDFINFIGISKQGIYNLSSRGLDLNENFKAICERSHINAAERNPKASTIHLAFLNKYHEWNGAGTSNAKEVKQTLTSADLPKLGGLNSAKMIDNLKSDTE